MGVRGELFSARARSRNDRRTYFFNVKENRRNDLFLTIVESKKLEGSEQFERHQIVVFEDDIELFKKGLDTVMEYLDSRDKGKSGRAESRRPAPRDRKDQRDRRDRDQRS
ncbi:MAG: DUF3276 family protein, partial [Alkalispirochaeta sp.]|jgi:hypothetical protein